MIENGLHDRLREAAGSRSYRHLGELTNTHPETVRRYMTGQSPSVEFVTAFVHALGVNTEWLLTGRGPVRAAEVKRHHLDQANASELLNAMAATLERLIARVERLELFLNTLETRIRAPEPLPEPHASHATTGSPTPAQALAIEPKPGSAQPGATRALRATSIAGSIPSRPRPDAG